MWATFKQPFPLSGTLPRGYMYTHVLMHLSPLCCNGQ